jgi:hypothetical protein
MPSTPDPAWNSRVRTCDNLIGRISFIWKIKPDAKRQNVSAFSLQPSAFFYRVSFGIPSPYFDHWAVYRQHEVTVITALDADPAVKQSIVNSLRPKIPKR